MSDTTATVVVPISGPQVGGPAPYGPVADGQGNPHASTPRSVLGDLRARRKDLKKNLCTELSVPRWGTSEVPDTPEVFLRLGPVDNTTFEEIVARRSKTGKGWSIWANADILVHSCQGVFACLDGDHSKKFSLKVGTQDESEPLTRFDPDLRDALGEHAATCPDAAHICRALFWTDGDLINTADKLMQWSGLTSEKLDEDFTTP